MHIDDDDLDVSRGMALHKMIRLITLATAGHGYLNFMGNEFGHPEWIDFPREGNNWSYRYARRQWRLADDPQLKYRQLARFDRRMIALATAHDLLSAEAASLLWEHDQDKVLIFQRGALLFAFNFHPDKSYNDYRFPAPPGRYAIVLNSDDAETGGHARVDNAQSHFTLPAENADQSQHRLSLYLPNRTALVLSQT
jgi:1,4-alpha-glucan branching enzyme